MPTLQKSKKRKAADEKATAPKKVPMLKLSHRLFAKPRPAKPVALAIPRAKAKTEPPAIQQPRRAPPEESQTEPYNKEPEEEPYVEEPIYRGSVTHLVLQKLNVLDPGILQDEPEQDQDDAESQKIFASKKSRKRGPQKAQDKGSSADDPIEFATEMHELEFHETVLRQKKRFQEGDLVKIRKLGVNVGFGEQSFPSENADVRCSSCFSLPFQNHSFAGTVVDRLSESCYIVKSSDNLGIYTLHTSQMSPVDRDASDRADPSASTKSSMKAEKQRPSNVASRLRQVVFSSLDAELMYVFHSFVTPFFLRSCFWLIVMFSLSVAGGLID